MLHEYLLYRLPSTTEMYLQTFSEKENGKGVFTLHSFDNQREINRFLAEPIQQTKEEVLKLTLPNLPEKKDISDAISQQEYLSLCTHFINKIKDSSFQKLILSRIKYVAPFDSIQATFLHLCEKYPHAFVYVLHLEGETWLGATPETLLQANGNQLSTMALAGTKAISENREWTEKEYQEHQCVVDYIADALQDFHVEKQALETVTLPPLQHLRTPIQARVNSSEQIADIVNQLHPTPAVCGIPKENAMQFILENEPHQRSFYSGYLGFITQKKTDVFVNLRCATLYSNTAQLYIGGGLTAQSQPLSEWNETELKSQALIH